MQTFISIVPVALFFIAFKLADIYIATLALTIGMFLQLTYHSYFKIKISRITWGTSILTFIMGTLTWVLRDERFIKMKPSLLYFMVALAFIFGPRFLKKSSVLGNSPLQGRFKVPNFIWRKLDGHSALFFISMSLLNILVANSFSTAAWVYFKIFGVMFLMFVFMAFEIFLLKKYSILYKDYNYADPS